MSENVKLVERAVEAFNRRDLRALADMTDEDLEFVSVLRIGSNLRGPHMGRISFSQPV
jgi:ketosteroid isomerase-like protein